MASLAEIRTQYPQYQDMTDADLAGALHQKFYSDIPQDQFFQTLGVGAAQAAPPQSAGMLANAAKPLTSYPETFGKMRDEGSATMQAGISQAGDALREPHSAAGGNKFIGGVGKAALGAVDFVTSPINAAVRTFVGNPVQDTTGIPKEYAETAFTAFAPMPKKIPRAAQVETRSAKTSAATADELFNAADTGYDAARASKATFTPQETSSLEDSIRAKLTDEGYRDFSSQKVFKAIEELKTADASNVSDIDAVRKVLNKVGADPAERDAVRLAIKEIDNFLTPKVPEIASARGNYAAGSRSEQITDAVAKGVQQAKSTNSGMNADNAIRAKIRTIRNNPKLSRGYSADELAQMDSIIEGNFAGNAARFLGNLGGGGGGIGSVITGVVTKGVAPVFGYAFKKLGSAITSREVSKLDELVRSRSPLSQQVGNPLRDWSKAAQTFETSPLPQNLARLTLSARNLAANLKSAGISVTPDSLVRSGFTSVPNDEEQASENP